MALATFLVAFAVAAGGNPSSVTCQPNQIPWGTNSVANGITYIESRRVELAPNVCAGMLFMLASPDERAAIAKLNPGVDPDAWMGLGALTSAHEAQHTTGIRDEAQAECRGYQRVRELLSPYVSGVDLDRAVNAARSFHQATPVSYQTVC